MEVHPCGWLGWHAAPCPEQKDRQHGTVGHRPLPCFPCGFLSQSKGLSPWKNKYIFTLNNSFLTCQKSLWLWVCQLSFYHDQKPCLWAGKLLWWWPDEPVDCSYDDQKSFWVWACKLHLWWLIDCVAEREAVVEMKSLSFMIVTSVKPYTFIYSYSFVDHDQSTLDEAVSERRNLL